MTLGQTLRFTNQDAETHNVHIENDFNQSMSPGQAHDFVPSRPGVLRLLCDVHSHMRGFVVVSCQWTRTLTKLLNPNCYESGLLTAAWFPPGPPSDSGPIRAS